MISLKVKILNLNAIVKILFIVRLIYYNKTLMIFSFFVYKMEIMVC